MWNLFCLNFLNLLILILFFKFADPDCDIFAACKLGDQWWSQTQNFLFKAAWLRGRPNEAAIEKGRISGQWSIPSPYSKNVDDSGDRCEGVAS